MAISFSIFQTFLFISTTNVHIATTYCFAFHLYVAQGCAVLRHSFQLHTPLFTGRRIFLNLRHTLKAGSVLTDISAGQKLNLCPISRPPRHQERHRKDLSSARQQVGSALSVPNSVDPVPYRAVECSLCQVWLERALVYRFSMGIHILSSWPLGPSFRTLLSMAAMAAREFI